MATKSEIERLAVLEEKTDNMDKKLDVLIAKFDQLETTFVTRREFSVAKWLIGVGFSVVAVVLGLIAEIRG